MGVIGGRHDRLLLRIEQEYSEGFRRYLRLAAAVSGRPDEAADIVQEAFVRAVRSRSEFRGDGPIGAWIWRIVLRTALSAGRREQPVELPPHPDAASREPDVAGGLRALVARLPERQRLILFLRFYGDLDYRTIAEVADVELGTVGPTLSAAMTTLRRMMSEVSQ